MCGHPWIIAWSGVRNFILGEEEQGYIGVCTLERRDRDPSPISKRLVYVEWGDLRVDRPNMLLETTSGRTGQTYWRS